MKKICLGTTSVQVPAVAAGCMRMGEEEISSVERFIDTAVEVGINYFDHADIYGNGSCETVMGKALAEMPGMRERLILQSKCGIVPGIMYDFSKEHIMKSVEESLKRLKTEYLDILLLHRPDALMEPEDNESVIDYLTDAVSDFLIKVNVQEISSSDAQYVNHVYQALSDLERIGDYAEILSGLTQKQADQNMVYSSGARQELADIYQHALSLYDQAVDAFYSQDTSPSRLKDLARIQHDIRIATKQAQQHHMDRVRSGQCSAEAGIVFGDMLNSINRIGGHSINIAEAAVASQN